MLSRPVEKTCAPCLQTMDRKLPEAIYLCLCIGSIIEACESLLPNYAYQDTWFGA